MPIASDGVAEIIPYEVELYIVAIGVIGHAFEAIEDGLYIVRAWIVMAQAVRGDAGSSCANLV
jgi:hypothetical protein